MTTTRRLPVYLTNEQHQTLRNLAFVRETSTADLIRQAVDEFLTKEAAGHYAGLVVTSRWYTADIEGALETNGFAPSPENVQAFMDSFRDLLAERGNELLVEMLSDFEEELELDAPNQQNLEEDSPDGETIES